MSDDVGSIIKKVYGRQEDAATRFGIGQSAVAGWVQRGYIPARRQVEIWSDAKRKGVKLQLTEIPISPADRRAA